MKWSLPLLVLLVVNPNSYFSSCRIVGGAFFLPFIIVFYTSACWGYFNHNTKMKISTKNSGIMCLPTSPMQRMLQVRGNTLQQVEKFKYIGVVFTSDGRWSEEVDTRLGKGNAFLRELDRFVVTKRELLNTAKLSVFKSVFFPTLTYRHESWVTTERRLTQTQAPEMGFLRRLHGVTQECIEVRWRPRQESRLAPPYSNLRSFRRKCTVLKKKLATFLGLFDAPSESEPGVLCPSRCAPRCDTLRQSAQS